MMMRFLLLASAELAAAESDHVSLLQTTVSKMEQHVAAVKTPVWSSDDEAPVDVTAGLPKEAPVDVTAGLPKEAPADVTAGLPKEAPADVTAGLPKEAPVDVTAPVDAKAACKAAKAKAKQSRKAMKALKDAFKLAKATFRTDKAAIKDACPKKDKKPRTPKFCGKGYTHAPGYVNGQGNVAWIEVITKGSRHQIGNHGGSDGKGPCNANPGGRGPHFGQQRVAGVMRAPFYDCSEDPDHEYNLLFCDNLKDEYKPYAAKISLGQQCVFCFAPICEKLCSDRPDCKSFEARINEGACELNTQTGPDRFPTWYKAGHGQNQTVPVPENYMVPSDAIFCVKSEYYQG